MGDQDIPLGLEKQIFNVEDDLLHVETPEEGLVAAEALEAAYSATIEPFGVDDEYAAISPALEYLDFKASFSLLNAALKSGTEDGLAEFQIGASALAHKLRNVYVQLEVERGLASGEEHKTNPRDITEAGTSEHDARAAWHWIETKLRPIMHHEPAHGFRFDKYQQKLILH